MGGYCYHALNRGNGRARVFHDANDYHAFVKLLREACARVPMRLVGYCLMPRLGSSFPRPPFPRASLTFLPQG